MTTAPSSPPDGPTPTGSSLARLIASALVLPVEVSSRLVEAVPAVFDKVPSAADRVRREIVLARFLGKMVVDQGVRELRSRLASHDDEATPTSASTTPTRTPTRTPTPTPTPIPTRTRTPAAPSRTEQQATEQRSDPPQVSTLALADYDHLSSAQVVGKLEGLDAAERRAIERYERAGRCRRTILGKLAQLEARE